MSSEDETYTDTAFECPEDLHTILANEEFKELFHFFSKLSKEDHSRGSLCLHHCLNFLIQSSKYETVLDLVSSFSDLYQGPWPLPFIFNKYFTAISSGDLSDLELLINSFGLYPNILSRRDMNLFEEAVFSKNLATVKFVKENLGIDSKKEKILLEAANMGHKGILQYLYEEVGIEPNDTCTLVKNAVEAGSLECLQYIRNYMGIGSIKDYSVIEFALAQSMQTHRLDILNYLITYFQLEFDPANIRPYKKNTGNKKNNCLFSTFHRAVQYNDTNFILFALHAVKIVISTKDPESETATYLELLSNCAKKGHFEMLKVLVEHAKMNPAMLAKTNEDELWMGIEKSTLKKKVKLKMLKFLKKKDLETDYEDVIRRVEDAEEVEPESASLKRVKYREDNADG